VGAVDVASFALRIASWSMARPRTDNVIILDEPFRFLSENYQERASNMLREVSQKLGIQLIIVTHETVLTTSADRIFEVSIKKGISQIKVL
jgi:DNA repair exonuclease SbcCD ATPase subunit